MDCLMQGGGYMGVVSGELECIGWLLVGCL
jgi:hypothetical protein